MYGQCSSIPVEYSIPENVPGRRVWTAMFFTFTRSFKGVEHEGAYNTSPQAPPQQMFALWAISKLVGNVKGTANMEYAS
jgi:hypothetical protein